MTETQRLTATLTPLGAALRLLLDDVQHVDPTVLAIADAAGCVAAETLKLKQRLPEFDIAMTDGWALRARDIVGASSYSPLQLPKTPQWIEAGERMTEGCDCVLDADLVEQAGPVFQVVGEVAPGHGMRRAGNDLEAGRAVISSGQRIEPIDLAVARAAGFHRLQVRIPRVRVVDVPSRDGSVASSEMIGELAKASGARVAASRANGRDSASIIAAIGKEPCDFLIVVGGTGFGRTDASVVHGLAIQPGRSAAVGKAGKIPVVAIPGAADQALAVYLMLVQPALDKLAGRAARAVSSRPLARKVSSSIGVAELALLHKSQDDWMPIAVGQVSLDAIVCADAWFVVPDDSEGYAAGTSVPAFALREN
jgi:molybdopterin biosynthesis enzyme